MLVWQLIKTRYFNAEKQQQKNLSTCWKPKCCDGKTEMQRAFSRDSLKKDLWSRKEYALLWLLTDKLVLLWYLETHCGFKAGMGDFSVCDTRYQQSRAF